MGRNSQPGASFYKLLNEDDLTSKLRIPIEFVKNYGGTLPSTITLRTDLSGKSWKIRMEQIGQEYFFTDGWGKFSGDVNLNLWDFLLFKFAGESAFNVAVYEITGAEREPVCSEDQAGGPRNFPVKVKTEKEDNLVDKENGSSAVGGWKFSKELKLHHFKDRLAIPEWFAVGTGIATNRQIKLQDAEGRKWPVKITDRNHRMFAMTAGWRKFLKGNKVLVGSTMLFEFIPTSDNIIQARVLKMGMGKGQSNLVKRGRGRPPSKIKS